MVFPDDLVICLATFAETESSLLLADVSVLVMLIP